MLFDLSPKVPDNDTCELWLEVDSAVEQRGALARADGRINRAMSFIFGRLNGMNSRIEIVRLLADGQFHSGQELAAHFGISRAAIWKQLAQVKKQFKLDIVSVKGRGYRLGHPVELLNKTEIRDHLSDQGRALLSNLEIHHQIASTNGHFMRQPLVDLNSGQVCLAEQQTAGRGRRGRSWISPFGSNIYLSLFWRFNLTPADLSGLSLVAGLAVIRALRQFGLTGIGLKWPNDVLFEEKKLAGLLLEMGAEQGGPSNVVLGLGLNTRLTPEEGAAIDQPWTDLMSLAGEQLPSRNRLASALVDHLLQMMERFELAGLEPFVSEWQQYDLYYEKAVALDMGGRTIEGVHRGIDSSGALLLETSGGVKAYHGGEVSLRRA